MLYSYEITVPANTPVTAPVDTDCQLTKGVITRVSFRPRQFHAGLCHVKVLRGLYQVWPTDPDGDLHGDAFPIEWDEYYELDDEPLTLRIRAWNDDDTYPHTFDISFALQPADVVNPQGGLIGGLKKLLNIMGVR